MRLDVAARERKQLEETVEYCQHWFKETDISLDADIRHSTSAEILVEHVAVVRAVKYLQLSRL